MKSGHRCSQFRCYPCTGQKTDAFHLLSLWCPGEFSSQESEFLAAIFCVNNSCKKERCAIAWNPGEVYFFVWPLPYELIFKADDFQDLFLNTPHIFLSR